jgi:hypothetical protein
MKRRLYETGITGTKVHTPPIGFKWRILSAMVWVTTNNTTAGTRTAIFQIEFGGNPAVGYYQSSTLAVINDTTGIVVIPPSGANTAGLTSTGYAQIDSALWVTDDDTIMLSATLVGNDTYAYNIEVDEVPA